MNGIDALIRRGLRFSAYSCKSFLSAFCHMSLPTSLCCGPYADAMRRQQIKILIRKTSAFTRHWIC